MPKILIWDIETSNLNADFGTLLAIGYKWLGDKKTTVLSITDYPQFARDHTNDRQLVKDFLKVYVTADMTVAFNGTLFDRPYLLAKCLEHKLPIPPNIPLQDPYFTSKSLRISRKSLQNVAYYVRLSQEKTPVEGRIWRRAGAGHKPSIDYIVRHCRKDVAVLEELYIYLRPLMRTHWRLGGTLGQCRFCSSERIQSRGQAMTKNKGEVKRIQCQDCGGWDQRTLAELKKLGIK